MSTNDKTGKSNNTRPAQHRAMCSICKHPELQEIERRYMAFETGAELASEFGFLHSSFTKHKAYLGLDEIRGANTEKALKIIISRGFEQNEKIDAKLFIECIKELNRIEGKRKEDGKNPADEANKTLADIRARHPELSESEARQIVAETFQVGEHELIG